MLIHECVVGFRVFAGDADVFVLDGDYKVNFLLCLRVREEGTVRTMLKVTTFSKETSPALNFSTRIL